LRRQIKLETQEFLNSLREAKDEHEYCKALIHGAMDAIQRCLKQTHDYETFTVLMMMCKYIGGDDFEAHLVPDMPIKGGPVEKLEKAIFGDEKGE
jgi:hypothetical protein